MPLSSPPQARTILIVEDDFDIRDLLQQFLESSGYETAAAANGLEALAALRAEESAFALILLDRNMEEMDGKLFLDALEADAKLSARKVPVVMMSAARDVSESRVVAFLHKPFNLPELLEVLERFGPAPSTTLA